MDVGQLHPDFEHVQKQVIMLHMVIRLCFISINWDLFTTLAGFWEDTVVDNIDEEYERLIQHLRDSAKKAEGLRTIKRRLSHETLELIRQRGAARATGNYQLTSIAMI
ncbi:hypothetical protein Y032_0015g2745 [Ancylostoma ceylanicum]|uniref:Uncharacterized protein n=2 Tax=Ancylostoma ceylanicum TaxID=53326 RepID=A0A016VA73_9BILA|nr:hypothetical protein Y032_0015g2745 [Ancylostoma ceylanicum]